MGGRGGERENTSYDQTLTQQSERESTEQYD